MQAIRRLVVALLALGFVATAHYLFIQDAPWYPGFIRWFMGRYYLNIPRMEDAFLAMLLLLVGAGLLAVHLPALPFAPSLLPRKKQGVATVATKEEEEAGNTEEKRTWRPLLRLGGMLLFLLLLFAEAGLIFFLLMTQVSEGNYTGMTPWLWVVVPFLLAVAAWVFDRAVHTALSPHLDWSDLRALVVLVMAGLLIGSYQLEQMPNSLIGDEGAFWMAAKDIATGAKQPGLFERGVYTFPVLSSMYQGLVVKIFGFSLWSWRFASVLAAVAGVVPTYLLAREMFTQKVATLAGAMMIVTPYFLAYARLGYNNTQSIPIVALALYLLYAGLRRQSVFYLFLGGVVAGLGFHTYTAARLALLVGGMFLGGLVVVRVGQALQRLRQQWRNGAKVEGAEPSGAEPAKRPLLALLFLAVVFAVGWAVTALPISVYSNVVYPELSHHKLLECILPNTSYALTFFSPEELFRDYPEITVDHHHFFYRPDLYGRLLVRGVALNGLAFFHKGVANYHFNTGPLPGPAVIGFFTIGLALVLASLRRPQAWLLVLWFFAGVVLLSVINTFPPRLAHMVPIIPAMSILSAVGLFAVVNFLTVWIRSVPWMLHVTNVLLIVTMGWIAMTGLENYFWEVPQKHRPDVENIIAFSALELESPRHLVYVYSTEEQKRMVGGEGTPWIINNFSTLARYHAVEREAFLSSHSLEPDKPYTFFFFLEDEAEVVDYLEQTFEARIIPHVYFNHGGEIILLSWMSR